MRFCGDHWKMMRQAIDDRALAHLVTQGGAKMVDKMKAELAGESEAETFDPLMSTHWSIISNTMRILDHAGCNSLALMASDGPDDGHWCPLCYINGLHERSCTDPKCLLDKRRGYDWMIDRAADDALNRARELGLASKAN